MNKTPITRKGQTYDSFDELYFAAWLDECKDHGLLSVGERSEAVIELTQPLFRTWVEIIQLKTKTKAVDKKQKLLSGSVYTPDFEIEWNPSAYGLLVQEVEVNGPVTTPFLAHNYYGRWCSTVEIKPDFDQNNMTRVFKNNQRFIWDKHRLYVNLIHTSELFASTFTPQEYLFTPKGNPRKVGWKVRTIQEFLKSNQ